MKVGVFIHLQIHILRLEEITYWSDGLKVKGLLAEPIADGRYEGIIYLRGGIQHVGMVRPSRIAQIASKDLSFLPHIIAVIVVGKGRDEFAGDDRLDAVNAVDVLKHNRKYNS